MFGLFESSRSKGTPVELFLFTLDTRVFAYTNSEDDITFGGQVYTASPITHSPINSNGTGDRQTLDVKLSDMSPLGVLLRGYRQSAVISLVIRQGHRTDADVQYLVAWAGRVLSAKGGDPGERVLTCQPVSSSLKRSGLRRNWQYPCPHVLYGDQCRASYAAATVTAVPTNAVRNQVTLPTGWNGAKPIDKYAGGLASWDGEVRTILRTTDTSVTLGGPADFAPGTTLSLSLGCDHLMDDCSTLHKPSDEADYGGGNIHNFGGQPFIPTQNPVGFVSNY